MRFDFKICSNEKKLSRLVWLVTIGLAFTGCRSRSNSSDVNAQVGDAALEDQNAELDEYIQTPEWMKMNAAFVEANRPLEFRRNPNGLKYANKAGLAACVAAMSKSMPTFLDRLKAFDPVSRPAHAARAPITVLISNRNFIYANRYLNVPGKPHLEIDCFAKEGDKAIDEQQLQLMVAFMKSAITWENADLEFSTEKSLDYLFWMTASDFESKYLPQLEKLNVQLSGLNSKKYAVSASISSKTAANYSDILVINRKSDPAHQYVIYLSVTGDDQQSWDASVKRWGALKLNEVHALPSKNKYNGATIRVVEQP